MENKSEGKHSADIKYERLYFNFDSSVTKIDGWMYGIGISYRYRHPSKNFVVKPELSLGWGNLDYDGPLAYSNSRVTSTGTLEGVDTSLVEFRVLPGYDAQLSETSSLIPYIGLGIRYLDIDMDGRMTYTTDSKTIQIGHKWYLDVYLPIGLTFDLNGKQLKSKWSFKATVEDDILLSNRGNGLRGSMEFQRRFKHFNVAVEPFIRYWSFGKTHRTFRDANDKIVGELYEPAKHITETGVALKVRF
ncbi:MAG: hypothetical protein EPN94_09340 [Nitrospirae bacterium]|nr:MAG: hypothetical protein EPN94_09340 [Nitrospirota bacterium]